MLRDFRAFILRGNVVDLAVGVVIGAAFGAIVTAIVTGLINPLISFASTGSLENKAFCIGGTVTRVINKVPTPFHDPCAHAFKYGSVLSSVISFVLIAAVVFFFVVKPVNHLTEKFKADMPVEKPMRDCPECESSIPINAKRCAFCTAEVPAVA
jgi:large conductance mechanosensitive channel